MAARPPIHAGGARWGLVVAGWSAYAVYYLGRVNFSVAAPDMEAQLGFGPAEIGTMAAGFFWVYSLAGVPVGLLADRVGPRVLVGLGLVGSGCMNLLFVHAGSFGGALAVWSLNGLFQAMGWAPLIGRLAHWVPQDRSPQVIAAFGSCFVAGTAVAFAVGGWVTERFGVDAAFIGSAAVLVPLGLVWWFGVRDRVEVARSVPASSWRLGRAGWLVVPAAGIGVAYVALIVWTPTYFVDVHAQSVSRSGALSASLPAVAIAVTLWIGRSFRGDRGERPLPATAGLLSVTALSLAAVTVAQSLLWGYVSVAGATALVSASSSVVLGIFPSLGAGSGVAFAGGVFALAFNLGGATASPVLGRLVDAGLWDALFLGLAASALVAAGWTAHWSGRLQMAAAR